MYLTTSLNQNRVAWSNFELKTKMSFAILLCETFYYSLLTVMGLQDLFMAKI